MPKSARHWVYLTKNFEQAFKNLLAAARRVRKAYEDIGSLKQYTLSSYIYR